MQVSKATLRSLGYLKIAEEDFCIDYIVQLNNEYLTTESKAWSFLPMYNTLGSSYTGISNLVKYLNLDGCTDNKSKRVFKYAWSSIWKLYGSSLSLDDSTIALISDFGIRLAFIHTDDKVFRDVIKFYNDILNWDIFVNNDFNGENIGNVLKTLVCGNTQTLRGYWENADSNN